MQTIDWRDVARWAATMPRDKTYNYFYNEDCAMAQYLRARGVPLRAVLGSSAELIDGSSIEWDTHTYDSALQLATFGELSDRLQEILETTR